MAISGNTAVIGAENKESYGVASVADVTGDCLVDMDDLSSVASYWLQCGNPFIGGCY